MQGFLHSELSVIAVNNFDPGRFERGRAGDVVWPHGGRRMDVKSDWRILKEWLSYHIRDAIEGASQASVRRQAFGVAQ